MTLLRATLLPAALAAAAGLAPPARAQGAPSAAQAASLEQQVRDSLAALSAGAVKLPARPVEITPEGDHYLVRVPFAPFATIDPANAAFTAHARMLDGGRWSIEDEQLPSQFKITGKAMVISPPTTGKPKPGAKPTETVTYDVKIGQQSGHRLFDPNFATATDSTATIGPIDILRTSASAAGLTHMDQVVSQTTTRPTDPAHVDLLSDVSATGYATESELPDGTIFKMTSKAVHVTSGVNGLAHAKLLPLLHDAMALSQAKPIPDGPEQKERINAALHQLLTLAQGLLTGGRIEETAKDVHFDFGGHVGAFTTAEIALAGDAPQDTLAATMAFSLDGLTLDDLPPALAAYVPTHIAFRPTLSNLNVRDLTAMALAATSPGHANAPAPPDVEALFSHGGITVGFDTLGLDIAGTQFAGSGRFVLAGPDSVTGQAELSAQGLDALITKAQGDPLLAQGVPVIIFLKGIAHTAADRSVWQVSVADGKALVNGVDLSAMAGAFKK